jgi:hypothetical protein
MVDSFQFQRIMQSNVKLIMQIREKFNELEDLLCENQTMQMLGFLFPKIDLLTNKGIEFFSKKITIEVELDRMVKRFLRDEYNALSIESIESIKKSALAAVSINNSSGRNYHYR